MEMGIDSELASETRSLMLPPKEDLRMSVPVGILTGMILGDSALIHDPKCKNALFKLQHGPKQKEYLLHKVAMLKTVTSVNVRHILDNGYGYESWIAETKTHPLYTRLRHKWYHNGRKTVTSKALQMLDNQGLAYWYMDDGSLTIHYRQLKSGRMSPMGREFHFHTQAFNYKEHVVLQAFLQERFGLDMRISPHKKKYIVLGCGAVVGKRLLAIIKPHILPMFNYKLDLKYQTS